MQVLAVWAFAVVPSGVLLRGPDMSLDMRLLLSRLRHRVRWVRIHGCGLRGHTWLKRGDESVHLAAYVTLLLDVPTAACSPVPDEIVHRGADTAPGPGRQLAGSIESPELASSLAMRLPASCWEALAPLPDVVLRLPAGTAGFFFLRDIANFSSLRRAGVSYSVEIALTNASSSHLSIMLRQELLFTRLSVTV